MTDETKSVTTTKLAACYGRVPTRDQAERGHGLAACSHHASGSMTGASWAVMATPQVHSIRQPPDGVRVLLTRCGMAAADRWRRVGYLA